MARTGENIYKRKDGRWEARYIRRRDESGAAKYGYIYEKSYKAVRARLHAKLAELAAAQAEDTMLFDAVGESWLARVRACCKPATFCKYRNVYRNHLRAQFGGQPIATIDTLQAERFIAQKLTGGRKDGRGGLSPKSVQDICAVLKQILQYAEDMGCSGGCNFRKLKVKQERQRARVLDRAEQNRLVSCLLRDMTRYKLGALICLYTGIRIGELCAIRGADISHEGSVLHVTKTLQRVQSDGDGGKTAVLVSAPKSASAVRDIPLPEVLTQHLAVFAQDKEEYILSGTRHPVEPRTLQQHFKHWMREADIANATFHTLRHSFATRCIETGMDAKSLCEILGHASVGITLNRYVHSSFDAKRQAINRLPLRFDSPSCGARAD